MAAYNRYLFVKHGCPHCRKYKAIRESINAQLLPEKRIKLVDVSSYVDFGIIMDPVTKAMVEQNSLSGVPLLYMDGFVVHGATTEANVKGWLLGYLKKTGEMK
jgi:glutaredoxin